MRKQIYLDHAATTSMWPEVCRAMEPYYIESYGNASANYDLGKIGAKALENARETIASLVGAKTEEIYFTSGGSESDNWAIKSVAGDRKWKGRHIITSQIEHAAVLNSCKYLERLGYEVTYLAPDGNGKISKESLLAAIRPDTTLISIMYANNEIGTIEPIDELGRVAREHGIFLHTDGVAVTGQLPLCLSKLPVDAFSASGHKFHGPKGVGFLYVRKEKELSSFIHGGAQEMGKRAGTSNVAGVVGMAEALRISQERSVLKRRKIIKLRDYLIDGILRECQGVLINGHPWQRLPGNVNVSFQGVEATAMLVLLEEHKVLASAGSACAAGEKNLSHVVSAIKIPQEYARGTIRFTLGEENTMDEMEYVLAVIKQSLAALRQAN